MLTGRRLARFDLCERNLSQKEPMVLRFSRKKPAYIGSNDKRYFFEELHVSYVGSRRQGCFLPLNTWSL